MENELSFQPPTVQPVVFHRSVRPYVNRGEELFQLHCEECHGEQGKGTKEGPELQHPSKKYSQWVLRNGRSSHVFPDSEMPAFSPEEITDEEAAAIWNWLDAAPHPKSGRALYVDFCGHCHGTKKRGLTKKYIFGKEFGDVKEKCRKGKGGTKFGQVKKYMPSWTDKELSDQELKRIAKYLKSQER